MHFITLAALISGGAASVIPTSRNPFEVVIPLARRTAVATLSAEICGSYSTVTVTPAVVTVTSSEYATTTAETLTTTDVAITTSTQEKTDVATVTEFTTSFVTETTTAATVTETVTANQVVSIVPRRKKRSCVHKTHLSYPAVQTTYSASVAQTYSSSIDPASVTSSASASSTSDSQTSSSTSPAAVCTASVTAPALTTVTTTTITGSAIATATTTITSLVIETTTTTVSTTEVIITAVPTTVPVTATTVVTSTAPPATPTFVLRASGDSVDGQYLILQPGDANVITFTSDVGEANSFYLTSSGALASTAYADKVAFYSNNVRSASLVIVAGNGFGTADGTVPMSCQLSGPTNIGDMGSFTCPNGGSALTNFAWSGNRLTVQNSDGLGSVFTLQYMVLS
ncbi:hypothetical protein PG984_014935 [Apiospora sp. TS-2023a]